MKSKNIIPYNPKLKNLARKLRKNSTFAEVLLWMNIKGRVLGCEFHRQVPLDEYIVDFFCHELKLVIEIDGYTHNYNYENEQLRQMRIESYGIRVLRFNDEDVKKHMNNVMRIIQAEIEVLEKKHPPDPLQRGN